MNCHAAQLLLNATNQTIKDIDSISGKDRLTDSFLAKFLVVYISGMYEEMIETIILDYLTKKNVPLEVKNYMGNSLKYGFQNPSFHKVSELIAKFNSSWKNTIDDHKGKRSAVSLDNINLNKNAIAHGAPVTITLSDIKTYYEDSIIIIQDIDSIFI